MELAALDPDEMKLDLPDERLSLEDTLLSEELQRVLYAAIDCLPDGFRLLLTLRHLQELSYAEIAVVTGLPLGTVKTGLHRARQQLRQHLEVYEAAYG
jgi:RNA polymerase sigma-70 factor (ECF subfamily)